MRKRREYIESLKIDLSTVKINLIPIQDMSLNSKKRTSEVLDLVIKMIFLATKKGPVPKADKEDFNAAA